MDRLYKLIHQAVESERIVFTVHADNRLLERRICRWQLIEGLAEGEVIQSHSSSKGNPKLVVRQTLPSGEDVVTVWGFLKSTRQARLITVYFPRRK